MTRRPLARAVLMVAALLATACGAGASSQTASTTSSPTGGAAIPGTPDTPAVDPGPGPTTIDGVRVALSEIAKVERAVALTPRTGTDDLYVAEQGGTVKVIRVTKTVDPKTNAVTNVTWALDPANVLDISNDTDAEGERGLLGIVFSSDGRRLYADYTDRDGNTKVVEYPVTGDVADTKNSRELLFVNQPFPNHNGGALAFGVDGFLYIGMGDGGGTGDPNGNGQNTKVLLGKVLRIDPGATGGTAPYAVPDGNPFANGEAGAPEVWLYGVRNPWRFSFDKASGDFWIGDVGQDDVEEIDRLPATDGVDAGKGANLGWNLDEGTQPFQGGVSPAGAISPIFQYTHENGNCAVIGGFVYRGGGIPKLQGTYLFGDYCVGDIRGLLQRKGVKLDERSLGAIVPGNSMTSFGQDNDGELYVLSGTGFIYRIVAA